MLMIKIMKQNKLSKAEGKKRLLRL